ncbi:agamous-like MADS-box protein AGL80 [Salvia miltiorrhiza]|uniref:agamous-like MADS-box protein AGL80 n=1 Tax=Salvia miltiorrhiza TaxID=226208 RepID=UPI0025AC9975|nr:agamous-like MADS-box protein AGL80 [Salvia miltiorrhiza]
MGRAKLKMELIEKEKSRNTTFKKRKEGLIRKVHEFTTLCDVSACMIIYGPGPLQPEIWPPQSPDQVRRIIDLYKSKNSAGVKSFGVADFFHERKKQIEDEVAKLRRKNLEAKYPTRPELLNLMNESQLRQFHALLSDKADGVRSRIESLRRKLHQSSSTSAENRCGRVDFEMAVMNQNQNPQQQAVEMLLDHHRLQQMHALNHHNSMMMHFEGGNFQLKRQFFFESASGYYAPPPPPLLPQPRPYLLQAVMPPQLQYLPNQDDLIQYQMRNQNKDGGQDEDLMIDRSFPY